MSEHHHDPIEDNIETHPVKLAIAVGVGAVALIVGIVMLAHFAIGTRTIGSSEAKANTSEAIAQRIAPVTALNVDPSKAPVTAAQPAAATAKVAAAPAIVAAVIPAALPAGTTAAKPAGGKGVYDTACTACHGTGVAGAPKGGDKGAWGARLAKGNAVLYDHALKGFNAMPAKGGNTTLADADVKAAVDYMVSLVK